MANKLPTINIKGQEYVLVKDRILYFNQTYPKGCIITELVSEPESDIIIVRANVYPEGRNPDPNIADRQFTGHSQAVKGAGFINKTAALENAETSAVGRALAMMGIGVVDSVASVDEINKAEGTDAELAQAKGKLYQSLMKAGHGSFKDQKAFIAKVLDKETIDSVSEANKVIKALEGGPLVPFRLLG